MNDYPSLTPDSDEDIKELLRSITEERATDIKDFDNLNNRFMAGRLVGKTPTSSADTSATDRVGDTNFDFASGYMYRVVDDAGTAVWARIQMDTLW